ncbi:MAG: PKD domain-containing protein [Candidatus Diapherotrites archaeon]|nr:PKD domain-containing protein [Candidatus Diapherotrites archaeon]
MKNLLPFVFVLIFIAVGISAINVDSHIDWSKATTGTSTTQPGTAPTGPLFAVWIKSPLGKSLEFKVNEEITFEGDSIGEAEEWLWNFGDGKTEKTQNATHKFSEKGEKKVVLTAKAKDHASGQDSDQITIKITEGPLPPKECTSILQCLAMIDKLFVEGIFGK